MEKEEVRGKQLKQKRIIIIIILFLLLFLLTFLFLKSNFANLDNTSTQSQIEDKNETNPINQNKVPKIVSIVMPETIEKYKVVGQLVIEKIQLEKYILHTTNDNSLELSITRYYGPQPNEVGNCCISGHNTKKAFTNLKELVVGDTFYIIDKKNSEKVTYQIYDIQTVLPTNLDCLNQETNQKREVTLITCNPRWIN